MDYAVLIRNDRSLVLYIRNDWHNVKKMTHEIYLQITQIDISQRIIANNQSFRACLDRVALTNCDLVQISSRGRVHYKSSLGEARVPY